MTSSNQEFKRKSGFKDINHLLNFKTTTPSDLPSTFSPIHQIKTIGRHKAKKKSEVEWRSERMEREARKKLSNSFFLHSSATHRFVITRQHLNNKCLGGLPTENSNYFGPDNLVMWELVRLVQSLVPATSESGHEESSVICPICLDTFAAPRITKCGHTFCFQCMIKHFVFSTTMDCEKGGIARSKISFVSKSADMYAKCPSCSHYTSLSDLRPIEFVTVQLADTKRGMNMRFRKLHKTRGSISPYLPCIEEKSSYIEVPSQGKSSCEDKVGSESCFMQVRKRFGKSIPTHTDHDAPFCRFNHLDTFTLLNHLQNDLKSLNKQLLDLSEYNRNENQRREDDKASYYLSLTLKFIQKEYEKAKRDCENESKNKSELGSEEEYIYVSNGKEVDKIDYTRLEMNQGAISKYREANSFNFRESLHSELKEGINMKQRVGLQVAGENNVKPNYSKQHATKVCSNQESNDKRMKALRSTRLGGTMYVGDNCTHFYQASDGQLIFLSPFNMKCLSSDFSASGLESCSPPFPDIVEGKILDIERIHLTRDRRKQMPFLSHLPLYTDIFFVELDLNHILSSMSRDLYKGEMQLRRKKRLAKKNKIKRAERIAKEKESRKQWVKGQINHLNFHNECYSDPFDEFEDVLPPTEEEFGPELPRKSVKAERAHVTEFTSNSSFRSVCTSNGLYPSLSEALISPAISNLNDMPHNDKHKSSRPKHRKSKKKPLLLSTGGR